MPAPKKLTFRRFQAQLRALEERDGAIHLADFFPRLSEVAPPQATRESAQHFLSILAAFQPAELDSESAPSQARQQAIAKKAGVSLEEVNTMVAEVAAVNAVVEDMQRHPQAATLSPPPQPSPFGDCRETPETGGTGGSPVLFGADSLKHGPAARATKEFSDGLFEGEGSESGEDAT